MDEICFKNVVIVGCNFQPPKGGIAQVLYTYKNEISSDFRFVINSGPTNNFLKLCVAVKAAFELFLLLLFHQNYKIVHIHTASYKSFERSVVSFRIAKFFNRKVVMHIHGGGFKDYYNTKPDYVSSILDQCDCVVALSKDWKEFFQTITTCENITIINNVISQPKVKFSPKNDSLFHLLFLGLICKEKGIYDLIDIVKDNRSQFDERLVLHIAGNGEVDKVTKIVESESLQNLIIVEGWVSGNQKQQLLSICDAFVLPSYAEGLPISILEAMSYGKPILASNVGGIPEIVSNNVNGILFQPADKSSIYYAILLLLQNTELCSRLGENSLLMCNPFLPNYVKASLSELYEKIQDS